MKSTTLRLILILVTLGQTIQLTHAQTPSTKGYSYMQIFYYGAKTSPGFSFMNFTPAFHSQTNVKLDEPSMVDTMFNPSISEGTTTGVAEVADFDDLVAKNKDPKYRAAIKERQTKERQNLDNQIKAMEERNQKMRDSLTKALNATAAEGWEVVQMSSYGDGGLVYLLRRAK